MESVGISPEGQTDKKPRALARGASFRFTFEHKKSSGGADKGIAEGDFLVFVHLNASLTLNQGLSADIFFQFSQNLGRRLKKLDGLLSALAYFLIIIGKPTA